LGRGRPSQTDRDWRGPGRSTRQPAPPAGCSGKTAAPGIATSPTWDAARSGSVHGYAGEMIEQPLAIQLRDLDPAVALFIEPAFGPRSRVGALQKARGGGTAAACSSIAVFRLASCAQARLHHPETTHPSPPTHLTARPLYSCSRMPLSATSIHPSIRPSTAPQPAKKM
jgi:hypothetical protein